MCLLTHCTLHSASMNMLQCMVFPRRHANPGGRGTRAVHQKPFVFCVKRICNYKNFEVLSGHHNFKIIA